MRFVAPERKALDPAVYGHPVYRELATFQPLFQGPDWPDVDALDAALSPVHHQGTGQLLEFRCQEGIDGTDNYEQRIFHRGIVSTRSANWHDLFNALAWKRFPAIKSALNRGQVEDMQRIGVQQRTRRQCAYTQFDEAGAIIVLRDPRLLDCWDGHDWEALFIEHRAAWLDGRIELAVLGHALHEHALLPSMLLVSKTLVIVAGRSVAVDVDATIAAALDGYLQDPQQLRPLPLSGIPGWHADCQDVVFYARQPCFRPLRPGRRYPPPVTSVVGPTSKG